jgi:hypothetical protein
MALAADGDADAGRGSGRVLVHISHWLPGRGSMLSGSILRSYAYGP